MSWKKNSRSKSVTSFSLIILALVVVALHWEWNDAGNGTRKLQELEDEISMLKKAIAAGQQQSPLPSREGFNPVYIFSNPAAKQSEIVKSYSQVGQDLVVLDLMKALEEKEELPADDGGRHHYFVDLASNHPFELSNTVHLEQNGWEGLCVEGNPMYWYGLSRFRSCTIVGAFVGGTEQEDGKEVDVAIPQDLHAIYGGIIGDDMDNKATTQYRKEKRDLVSILTVFKHAGVPSVIDYFSLDVEGAESIVMADFPWDDYKFRFITIEKPKDDLRELLESHGYVHVMDLIDWETLWMHESVNMSVDEARTCANATLSSTN